MKVNALIVGAGYFSQRIHINALKKNKKIKKIYLFDERKKLQDLVAKRFNLECLRSFNLKEIKEKKIKLTVISFVRELSFYYTQKAIKMNLHVLAEKPVVSKKENLMKIIKESKKRKRVFQVCYQKKFSPAIIFLKKNMHKMEKAYGSIKTVIFELFNGDMRNGTRSFCRTDESIKYRSRPQKDLIKLKNRSNLINYKIFINRYIHSINLFSNIFKMKNYNVGKLNILSKYNYSFLIKKKINEFYFFFGDYNFNKWHDNITIFFEKAKLTLSLNAPLNFEGPKMIIYNGNLKKNKSIKFKKDNIFTNQLNFFLSSIYNKEYNNFLDEYENDYNICKKLWKIK